MRKQVVVLAIVALAAFTFTSCKNDAKEEVKTEESSHDDAKAVAENVLYQCPMDCEDGKSYTEEGNCPICKMALKEKKVDMDGDKEHEQDGE